MTGLADGGPLRALWRLSGARERRIIAAGVALRFAQAAFQSAPVGVLAWVIEQLRTDALTSGDAWAVVGFLAGCLAGQLLFGYLSNRVMWGATYEVVGALRLRLVEHLARLPLGFHAGRRAGDTLTAATADLQSVENYQANALPQIVGALCAPVLIAAGLAIVDPLLALATVASIAAGAPVFVVANRLLAQTIAVRQDAQALAAARMVEYVQGIATIRAYRQEGERLRTFRSGLEDLRAVSARMARRLAPLGVSAMAVVELGVPVVIGACAYALAGGTVDAGTALIFLVLVLRVYQPLIAAAAQIETARLADASLRRIARVLDEPLRPAPPPRPAPERFDVAFEHVSFSYEPGVQVLSDVSFTCPQNTTTAIVGPSGAGKSTVLHLVARFWDPTRGTVRIGGVDLRELSDEQVLDAVTIVFQDVVLFSGTIRENIAFGRPGASDEQVEQAARRACAHDFVAALPNGYDTQVGEGGAMLSGGERQRISIARALVKDAPIVLLDEVTAAIDPTNERLVQQALAELVAGRTLLVVAHRLATIRSADQILVLDDGRIAERGVHDELLAAGGLYARLWAARERAAAGRMDGARRVAPR